MGRENDRQRGVPGQAASAGKRASAGQGGKGKQAGKGQRAKKEVAGMVVRRTRWAPAQRVRAQRQWCAEDEDIFLDCLAATCNVRLACDEADVAYTSVYRQRLRRADFALKWQAALEQGYAALEMQLVEAANRSLSGERARGPYTVKPMSADTALRVLNGHRAAVTGRGRRGGYQSVRPTLEQVQDSILAKIAVIRRARGVAGGVRAGGVSEGGGGGAAVDSQTPGPSRDCGKGEGSGPDPDS